MITVLAARLILVSEGFALNLTLLALYGVSDVYSPQEKNSLRLKGEQIMLSNNGSCPSCGRRFTQAENVISCPACQSLLPEKMVQISTPETALRYISIRSPEAFRDERVLCSTLQDLLGRYFFRYRFVAELYKVAPQESAAFLEGNGCCDQEALRRSLYSTSASKENIDRYIDILCRSAGIQANSVSTVHPEKTSQASSFEELNLMFGRDYGQRYTSTEPESDNQSEDAIEQLIKSINHMMNEEEVADSVQKDYSYEMLPNGTIYITKYSGRARNLTIPKSIDGFTVTAIGEAAFYGKQMESVVIPNNIQVIEKKAFAMCTNLVSIQLPDNLIHLGEGVFSSTGSHSLMPLLKLPESLLSFGGNPFCSMCFTLYVPQAHPSLVMLDGVLFHYSMQTLLTYPYTLRKSSYTIPAGTRIIANSAFTNNIYLKEVIIPAGVTQIGESAFALDTTLESINIPNTIRSIGSRAFFNCRFLRSIELPDGVVEIGSSVFKACIRLTSIRIPASVEQIGENIFEECANITATVQKGSYAADYCEQNNIPYRFEGGSFFLFRNKRK